MAHLVLAALEHWQSEAERAEGALREAARLRHELAAAQLEVRCAREMLTAAGVGSGCSLAEGLRQVLDERRRLGGLVDRLEEERLEESERARRAEERLGRLEHAAAFMVHTRTRWPS